MLAKAPLPGIAKTRLVPPLTPGEAAALARAFAEDLSTRLSALARALDAEFFIYHTPDGVVCEREHHRRIELAPRHARR